MRDLRGLPWASIDNDDSRDLDQLTVAERLADGGTRILVAIADVDALVPRDSPIDRHAAHNTTAVYTPAMVFRCCRAAVDRSDVVAPGQDRLAVVMEMTVAADGTVTDDVVYRALVHNHAKLAYPSVAAWLEGEGQMPPRDGAVRSTRRADLAAGRGGASAAAAAPRAWGVRAGDGAGAAGDSRRPVVDLKRSARTARGS